MRFEIEVLSFFLRFSIPIFASSFLPPSRTCTDQFPVNVPTPLHHHHFLSLYGRGFQLRTPRYRPPELASPTSRLGPAAGRRSPYTANANLNKLSSNTKIRRNTISIRKNLGALVWRSGFRNVKKNGINENPKKAPQRETEKTRCEETTLGYIFFGFKF